MEGTAAPASFSSGDVLAWLAMHAAARALPFVQCVLSTGLQGSGPTPTLQKGKSETYVQSSGENRADIESAAYGQGGMGSVSIGRLTWGTQGPTPRILVQDGCVSVMVDRHGSRVGNPFCGAPRRRLCEAYDELLMTVMTMRFTVEDALHDYEELRRSDVLAVVLLTTEEKQLLRIIAEKHRVRVHSQPVKPLDVRAWLVHHAALLVGGQSLRLYCWCLCGDVHSPAWSCHAQSLMGALLWLSTSLNKELSLALCFDSDECGSSQVCSRSLVTSLHTFHEGGALLPPFNPPFHE
jgi:hypothetical protein